MADKPDIEQTLGVINERLDKLSQDLASDEINQRFAALEAEIARLKKAKEADSDTMSYEKIAAMSRDEINQNWNRIAKFFKEGK